MNHDGHNSCQHPQMAYCRVCDAAYCRACAREWPQRIWNYTYPSTSYTYTVPPTWTTGTTWTGGEAGSSTITSAACSHN